MNEYAIDYEQFSPTDYKNNYVLLSLLQSCRAIQIAMTFFNRKIRTAASYQQVDFMRRRFDLFTLALRGVLPDIE